jgi:hypothetical protein
MDTRDSDSGPQGENSRSEVEGATPQSGGAAASPTPSFVSTERKGEVDPDVRRRLLSVCQTLETAGGQAFPIDFHVLAADIRQALSTPQPALAKAVEALERLTNEVEALDAFADGIREVIGNTNYAVLRQRVAEALTTLRNPGEPHNSGETS